MAAGETVPPVIETERLRLRPHEAADFDACVAMWSDPRVARYTIGEPSPPPQTWRRILAYRGHWTLLGFGYWAVEERDSGRYIGDIGFAEYKRDIQPSIEGMPELGWALIPAVHGKGYATEALRAAVAWGDVHFGAVQTVCIIREGNVPSFRVAEKLGYAEVHRTSHNGETTVVLYRSPTTDGAL
ncbi:MAG TPA: GNAT family N-acetyltransferase [Gemmatimonadaceae bacterium]|nr:GNAT family N-acetyltransferase [Gemmatimonadaceae bacterium]